MSSGEEGTSGRDPGARTRHRRASYLRKPERALPTQPRVQQPRRREGEHWRQQRQHRKPERADGRPDNDGGGGCRQRDHHHHLDQGALAVDPEKGGAAPGARAEGSARGGLDGGEGYVWVRRAAAGRSSRMPCARSIPGCMWGSSPGGVRRGGRFGTCSRLNASRLSVTVRASRMYSSCIRACDGPLEKGRERGGGSRRTDLATSQGACGHAE